MTSKLPHVVVVGAGIIGASLTYHLARQSVRVTLIDVTTQPGGDATANSFAWLVAGQSVAKPYLHFRQQAIADWHRVEGELSSRLTIDWSGAITWCQDTATTMALVRESTDVGYPVRLVDRPELRRLEPDLKQVPTAALFAEQEGAIDPIRTTALLTAAARAAGADIQLGNAVLAFITHGIRVTGVVTTNGNLLADVVVVAAGGHTAILCQSLGLSLPITMSPAILMAFHTSHRFVNRVVSNPLMEIRAASPTLTLATASYIDESEANNPQAIAQRTLTALKEQWQGTEHLQLADVRVGNRPMPQDGLPVIGRPTGIEGLYVSVMHSGVTLAALVGRLAAAEIAQDQEDRLVSAYRPSRFD